jgi:phytoene dehydrogenase-like protein
MAARVLRPVGAFVHRSVDSERIALWLDRSADRLVGMREMKPAQTLPAIHDAYVTLAFLVRVAEGRAYLRGGSARLANQHIELRGDV